MDSHCRFMRLILAAPDSEMLSPQHEEPQQERSSYLKCLGQLSSARPASQIKRIEIFSSGDRREENRIHSWPGMRHELICLRRQTIVYDRLG
ncbi:hypothetical protein PVAP13_1NG426719 [Panicum virgatum]|uniref:Uncharacterized protein n=1 Tax=Panicum virgatum TaxID=38727 RepID=A0A8T0X0X2_PANVG|nr:hypothetical protein PVAP13_1NG426719 [Panicum virgatum]